jgi:hypothetical protein
MRACSLGLMLLRLAHFLHAAMGIGKQDLPFELLPRIFLLS